MEGKGNGKSGDENQGKAESMSQKVVGERGIVNSRQQSKSSTVRRPFKRSGTQGVCFPVKDGAYCSAFCDPTAVLVCSRAEGLPLSQALSRLAFRGQK